MPDNHTTVPLEVVEITFDSPDQLFEFFRTEQLRPSRWIFRGQQSASWPLQPTLERFEDSIRDLQWVIEPYCVRQFQRRAHHYSLDLPDREELLEWIALMRHHGCPTRLLDFSKSPYIAAFFATAEADPKDDASIWAVDTSALAVLATQMFTQEINSMMALGKPENGVSFRFSEGKLFHKIMANTNLLWPKVILPVEPFRTNERVLVQQGVFLCPSSAHCTFEQCLQSVQEFAKKRPDPQHPFLYRLTIRADVCPFVLRELHRMNLNYASLYPGLDGLARSLATVSKIRATTVPYSHRPDWEFDLDL